MDKEDVCMCVCMCVCVCVCVETGNLPNSGLSPGIPCCRHIHYHLSHQGSLIKHYSIIKLMNLDICDKDGIWGNYAKWNKSHSKKILYNFTHVWNLKHTHTQWKNKAEINS